MNGTNFETAEVGDWFEANHGMVDYFTVVDIEETFGDRVRVVVEGRSISTETESDTVTRRLDEHEINNDYERVEDPRED